MAEHVTASCLVIGNEILSGKVRDSNAYFLAGWLRQRGVDLQRIQVVPDVVEVMAEAIVAEHRRSDFVITSGGIGPTHDDLTYRGVAAALGREVRRHPEVQARMESFYGVPQSEVRLRMADMPHPCQLHFVEGLWVPVLQVENVFVLPGIPMLFERLLEGLSGVLATGTTIKLHNVFTHQTEEELAPLLEAVLVEFPSVEIGSYPRLDTPEYRVRVTLESRDHAVLSQATHALVARMDPARLVRVERH